MFTHQNAAPRRGPRAVMLFALVLLLFPDVHVTFAQMSGSYTIDASAPTGGTNFHSFSDAIDALKAQGISADVTFTVAAGTYDEMFTIPLISSAFSPRPTITFDGGPGGAAARVITYSVPSVYKAIVTLDGAIGIRLRNLTIRSTNATYGYGVLFTNSADNNEIRDCIIGLPTNSTSQYHYGIIASSKTSYANTGDHGSNNLIVDNEITGGYCGIRWNGHSNTDYTVSRGNQFIGNTVTGFYLHGLYYYIGSGAMVVRNNTVIQRNTGAYITNDGYGIYANCANDGPEISGNVCRVASGGLMLPYLNYVYENTSHRARVFNNMSIAEGTSNAYGLYAYNAKYADIIHNSCRAKSIPGPVYGYYCQGYTTFQDVNFANNMVSCETQGTFHAYVSNGKNGANAYSVFDYNILYETGTSTSQSCTWNGTNYGTFANMKANVSGFHQHSVEADPMWLSPSDLHSTSTAAYRAGIPFAFCTVDFDGESRYASAPCIGADEYGFCTISCPADIVTSNDEGMCGAAVTFQPTVSQGCGDVVCTPPSGSFFPVGTTTVNAQATAGPSCTFTVTVKDAEPPVMTLAAPISLWPVNHKFVTVTVAQMIAGMNDNCDALTTADVYIVSAASDEAVTGGGSGGTMQDIVIGSGCQSVDLRSERAGTGNGRVYSIVLKVEDKSGNAGYATFLVYVPHSVSAIPIQDAPQYVVTASCGAPKLTASAPLPQMPVLEQNYPNPFNPRTTIPFSIPDDGQVVLRVYDTYGRAVATLVDAMLSGGRHILTFAGDGLPSGIYICRLEAGGRILQRNMMLLK